MHSGEHIDVNLKDIIQDMRREWGTPKAVIHYGQETLFTLVCEFSQPASEFDIEQVGGHCSPSRDLIQFWHLCAKAKLFKDVKFSQWGLVLYSPGEALSSTENFRLHRNRDCSFGDLIVGEFLGDSDLLLLRCDPDESDYGSVRVVNAIDPRSEWDSVSSSLSAFLGEFAIKQGCKFWEHN